MTTALHQLRQAIVAGQKIEHDDSAIILQADGEPDVRLPRTEPTNFRSLHGKGAPYTLETIYFQYQFREYPYNEYFQSCKDKGVQHAFLLDKKELLAYLSGSIDTCASIADDAPAAAAAAEGPPAAPAQPDGPAKQEPEPVPRDKTPDPQGDNDVDMKERERVVPRATAHDSPAERSRKRERDQCVLDASFTVIGWDYSQLRDKLVSSLASNKRAAAEASKSSAANGGNNKFDPRGDRYTNNEGRFWRENLGSDFSEMGIDMTGSFKAKPKNSAPSSSQSASRERGASGGDRAQRGSGGGAGQHQQSRSGRGAATAGHERKKQKLDPKHCIPIVIVPAGDSSLISAMNAVEFMNEGHFLSRDEMQKSGIPSAQPARKMLRRKPGGNCSAADYLVVSNPNRLAEREWDQVVAVVCSGQAWQFKKWPLFKGSAQGLFHSVQGFYFHFDDSPPTGDVREWPVRMMPVSRDRRHTDGSLRMQFWSCLDSFVARKKSHLRY